MGEINILFWWLFVYWSDGWVGFRDVVIWINEVGWVNKFVFRWKVLCGYLIKVG